MLPGLAQRLPAAHRHLDPRLRADLRQPRRCWSGCPARCRCATPSSSSSGPRRSSHLHDGRRALPAGPAAGRADPRAGRGAGGHPRHPPVGPLPGPGHLRVRRPGPEPAVRHQVRLRRRRPSSRSPGPRCSASPAPATRPSTTSCWPWSWPASWPSRWCGSPGSAGSCGRWPTRRRPRRASASTPPAARVLVFCLTAFLAAVAGGLLGTLTQVGQHPRASTSSSRWSGSPSWSRPGAATLGGAVLAAVAPGRRCRRSSRRRGGPRVAAGGLRRGGHPPGPGPQRPGRPVPARPTSRRLAAGSAWRRRSAGSRRLERTLRCGRPERRRAADGAARGHRAPGRLRPDRGPPRRRPAWSRRARPWPSSAPTAPGRPRCCKTHRRARAAPGTGDDPLPGRAASNGRPAHRPGPGRASA